ncbi:MAG: DUF2934 domain-containing protein [Gammaproteobacteria bacterium]
MNSLMAVNVTAVKLTHKVIVAPNHRLMEGIAMTHQPNEVKAATATATDSAVVQMEGDASVIVRELPDGATTLTAEEREQLIAEAAYRIAEVRGFGDGHELDDWLEAEKEVDALLAVATDRGVAATMRRAS